MTPANPDNNKPFIYRIADALGITHLVVAVQHSHLMSEIEGLVSALAGKSDTNHSHKTIQYNPSSSTDGYAGFSTTGEGNFSIYVEMSKSINLGFGGMTKASITNSNADNLARALQDPDTTPTADSDNLVTSGGVKAALANKMDNKTIDSTPTLNSQNLVTSGGVAAALNSKAGATHTHIPTDIAGLVPSFVETAGDAIDMDDLINDEVGLKRLIIKNVSGGHIQFGDLLTSPSFPVHPNANASTQIDDGDYALVTIYKIDKNMDPEDEHEHDLCYFVTLDGIFGPV